jgi:exopolysaccharide production protein ExoQ
MNVLLNPIIISLVFTLLIVICSIFVYAIGKRSGESNLLNLEQSFTFVFFTLLLMSTDRPYIGSLTITYLGVHFVNKNAPLYVTLQLVTYAVVIFLLRSRIHYLFKAIIFLCRDPFLVGLLLLTVLSSFWSETPFDTFKASLVLLVLALYASIIAVRCNSQELTQYLRAFGAWMTGSTIVVQLLFPSVSENTKNSWEGFTGHPNVLGPIMALSTVLWVLNAVDRPKQRWGSISLAIVSLIVMVLTNSGAAKFVFVALMSVSILFQMLKHLHFRQAFVSFLLFLIFGIFMYFLIVDNTNTIFELMGKDKTLTGRGEFWPSLIAAIQRRFLFGYGYQGFWQSWRGPENPAGQIMNPNGFTPTHSHNGFLELALDLGLVGIGLFTLSFLRNTLHVFLLMYSNKPSEAEISLLLLTYIICSNFAEPGLWSVGYHTFILVLISVRHSVEISKVNLLNKTMPP